MWSVLVPGSQPTSCHCESYFHTLLLSTQGTHCVVGVPYMHPQLGQHPDAVGELHGLVKHVLTLHRPLGDGEDVAALQLVGGGVWWGDHDQR